MRKNQIYNYLYDLIQIYYCMKVVGYHLRLINSKVSSCGCDLPVKTGDEK